MEIATVEGKMQRGWASPAIPTLMFADPSSITMDDVCLDAAFSNLELLYLLLSCDDDDAHDSDDWIFRLLPVLVLIVVSTKFGLRRRFFVRMAATLQDVI